jgi:ATP-dependent protease ClpP protease subunit
MKRLWLVLLVLLIGVFNVHAGTCPECPKCELNKTMEMPNEGGILKNTFIENGKAYMYIYLSITEFTAKEFWNDITVLNMKGVKDVHLYLSSGGGSALAGLSLADQIEMARKKGFNIEAHASGIIASATVPVFAVCSKRFAAKGTIFMVHEASIFKYFSDESKSDIRSQNALMELLTTKYMDKLIKYSNLTLKQWEEYERDTTWFDADRAKDWGLVDEIE